MQNRTKELAIATKAALMRGWTKGTQARDANGNSVSPRDDGAVSFCLVGAIEIARHQLQETSAPCIELLRLMEARTRISPVVWSDHSERRWEDVLALIDDVIAGFEPADTEAVLALETVDA